MPHLNRLTETAIRNAIPLQRPYKLSDGGGVFLIVNPNRSKWWRFRYRYGLKSSPIKGKNQEKEKLLSLGTFPEVRLEKVRQLRDKFREMLREGKDPAAQRRLDKLATGVTFKVVAEEYLKTLETPSPKTGKRPLDPDTVSKGRRRLEQYIYPALGTRPIGLITVPELFAALKKVQDEGKYETCKKVRQWCGRIWRYAVVTGRAPRDLVPDLRGAMVPVPTENYAAITAPERIGVLLRAIEGYTGQRVTVLALRLSPILFTRPSELRKAKWEEFDLARAEWRIPARRMKMRDPHVVPLPRQAVEILTELHTLTGWGTYLFPNVNNARRPMSENTLNAALCTLGFSGDEMTVHGFRTLASTRMNEMDQNPDLIELQLAHLERNPSRRAYNKAMKLPARKRLMQWWADVLDELRNGTPPEHSAAHGALAAQPMPGGPTPSTPMRQPTAPARSARPRSPLNPDTQHHEVQETSDQLAA